MKKVIMFGIEKITVNDDFIVIYNRKVDKTANFVVYPDNSILEVISDNSYKASVKALKKGYAELMKGRAIA